MFKEQTLMDNVENVNNNLEQDLKMKELRDQVLKKFDDYRITLNYMAADAPIGVLCLPTATEKILIDNGFLRIYDVFNVDLTKIKGLGVVRIRDLTSRIDQFLSML